MEPLFSKILTQTDVKKRLSFPTEHLKSLPPFTGSHAVVFHVTDERSGDWIFKCSIRREGPYKKPVLTGKWTEFVRSMNLEMGDRVTFFKDTNSAGGVTYWVQAEKQVQVEERVEAEELIQVEEEPIQVEEQGQAEEPIQDEQPIMIFGRIFGHAPVQAREPIRLFGVIIG